MLKHQHPDALDPVLNAASRSICQK
jgi:hypothetical protein